jgi:uncharacterized protein
MLIEKHGKKLIVPPFTEESARAKVKAAEDAWNSRDSERVALAYTEDSVWRNRTEFFRGGEEIEAFLRRKWARETQYQLMKELWCDQGNRVFGAVRVRVLRRSEQPMDARTWKRALGVRRGRSDAP